MNEIVLKRGGNHYKIPHMSKGKLEKAGTLTRAMHPPLVVDTTDALSDRSTST